MSEYKLKTGKLGDKVIGTYRKVEDAFVDRFLEKDPNDPGVLRMKPGKLGKAVMQGYQTMEASVYKGYKRDEIEMRGDRAEMSDFPLYLNTVAGGLDCRDQTIGGFSFVVKIYAVPVVEIIG